tara:strand:+ start:216 stop:356 length:141 start_codon:yes stop_codon:yes gene_type:complete
MIRTEEKIARWLKIAVLFLFTLLGVSLASEKLIIVILLFYIAFIKE